MTIDRQADADHAVRRAGDDGRIVEGEVEGPFKVAVRIAAEADVADFDERALDDAERPPIEQLGGLLDEAGQVKLSQEAELAEVDAEHGNAQIHPAAGLGKKGSVAAEGDDEVCAASDGLCFGGCQGQGVVGHA